MPDPASELERAAADIQLTREAREALARAASAAARRGADRSTAADVLEAALDQRGSLADQAIRALGLDPKAIAAQLPGADTAEPSIPLRQLLVNANREAQVLGHHQVDSIHLLLAMLYSDSPATAIPLQKGGLTLYDLRRELQSGAARPRPSGNGSTAVPKAAAALRRRPWPSLRGVLAVSPVFLGIVALTALAGVLLWLDVAPGLAGPLTIAFVTAGWITTLCIHEFSHAVVAYLGGDRAVATSGYLTLDPLRYTNLVLSVVMPILFLLLGGIGLPGGAVYINRSALRSRTWDSAVSAAGPLGTLVCLLLLSAPFLLPGHERWATIGELNFLAALAFLCFIEAVAVLLNLLPIPGLDGFGIVRPWLPYSVQASANRFGAMAIFGVFIVLWYVAPIREAFFQSVLQLTALVQINPELIALGQLRMRLF